MRGQHASINSASGDDGYLVIDGLQFHYLTWGEAEKAPVICLHGLRSYGATFAPLGQALADRYHVISLDQRGRGETDWDPGRNYYTDRYVLDLAEFVDMLGLDRFHLLGHSMGGVNALVYTQRFAERVLSLILEDAGPGAWRDSAGAKRIDDELRNTPAAFSNWDEAERFWRSIRPNVTGAAIQSRVANSLREQDGRIVWRHDQAGIAACRLNPEIGREPPDLWNCVNAIGCPSLVLRGENSDYLSADVAAKMAEQNSNFQVRPIEGAGHYVHDDNPDSFIVEVSNFLLLTESYHRKRA